MSPREAFEAWADARDATHAGQLRSGAAGFNYPLGRLLDECWQAAIQYALNVAVRTCESRIMGDHNREDQEAQRCADAIKEALK